MKSLFPSTRFQGSKVKLLDWLWLHLKELQFETVLDAFGGTGAVAYRLKQEGKQVTYNDLLKFNFYFAKALIENNRTKLSTKNIQQILTTNKEFKYKNFIAQTFQDIYFTDAENNWLDQTIQNMAQIQNSYKFALAFFALSQACLVKRPYNLFHRKNLYVRLADVKRSFGNKTSWDKPFETWFYTFALETNQAIFDNGLEHKVLNQDALTITPHYDLVYLDPPYLSNKGVGVDYLQFYHFLEGLTQYQNWEKQIDYRSKHLKFLKRETPWTDRNQIYQAFENLFKHFQQSILVLSYRSDGIPSEQELFTLLKKYKKKVELHYFGPYKYALSKNSSSKEILLIGT